MGDEGGMPRENIKYQTTSAPRSTDAFGPNNLGSYANQCLRSGWYRFFCLGCLVNRETQSACDCESSLAWPQKQKNKSRRRLVDLERRRQWRSGAVDRERRRQAATTEGSPIWRGGGSDDLEQWMESGGGRQQRRRLTDLERRRQRRSGEVDRERRRQAATMEARRSAAAWRWRSGAVDLERRWQQHRRRQRRQRRRQRRKHGQRRVRARGGVSTKKRRRMGVTGREK
ncbi:hypothetical protein VIGAN_09042500 [Vigna angularis var. angularis]|uniref:Uncharacterized protein n=1 Tax=Vigna angularis var. angularis TaxID=157739 RepID=A0A0S3SWJ8_PHAAN|nr:hypothetical protein VIGAN_09042500 [Vigna angularis var. angularis]